MPKRFKRQFEQLAPWGVPVLLILIWQFLSQVGWLSNRVLPAPTAVVQAAIQLASTGELLRNVYVSAVRALIGFAIGGSIGFIFGLLNGTFRISEQLFDTSIQMLRNIPHLAMIPLVILWFGIGDQARIFLVASAFYFRFTSTPFTAFTPPIRACWKWVKCMD